MTGGGPRFLNRGGAEPMAQTEQTQGAPITLTQEQFAQLLSAIGNNSGGGMTADELAEAMARSQKKENAHGPGYSVFNPRGETKNPRPMFVAKSVWQNGMKLDRDTLSWEEIEGINALPPGDWMVTKADSKKCAFTVKHIKGNDGLTLERLEFAFPCRDEQRESHRGLFDYFVEVLEQSGNDAEAIRLLDLRKQLNKERAAVKVA